MQLLSLLALGGLASSVAARSPGQKIGKKLEVPQARNVKSERGVQHVKRQAAPIITTEASKSKD
jgi:carboxypeptidase D